MKHYYFVKILKIRKLGNILMSFKGQSIFTTTKSSGFVFFAHIKQDNEAN